MRKHLNGLLTKAAAMSLVLMIAAVVAAPSSAGIPANTDHGGIALRGFDPVAYTADGTAMQGQRDIVTEWRGATYRFASAFNRSVFMADPDSFLAQFDGYCAFGAAMGQKVDANPAAWTEYDGKIYLFNSQRVKGIWQKNARNNVERGMANWSSIQ